MADFELRREPLDEGCGSNDAYEQWSVEPGFYYKPTYLLVPSDKKIL